ncbi:hypothetical protein V8F20_006311 [Naviculisporaceae sp. PSN 640]
MGGKVWSKEEEDCFWNWIIPQSTKRLGVDRANGQPKSWEELRKIMKARMGDDARREYTDLGLFEHFFQNAIKERYSPNALSYAKKYVERAKQEKFDFRADDDSPRRHNHTPRPSGRTPGSQRTNGSNARRSNYEPNRKERGSPRMKEEDSPRPFEPELPPFNPPRQASSRNASDPFESPAPRVNPNYPTVEGDNWNGDQDVTSPVPRHYNSTPASHAHLSSSGPRSQTARLEARMQRRHDMPARIRRSARSATSDSTTAAPPGPTQVGRVHEIIDVDDPFVDSNSSPVPQPNMSPAGYGGPQAYRNLAHGRIVGLPPRMPHPNFGQAPMLASGNSLPQQAPVSHWGTFFGQASTGEMAPPPLPRPNSQGTFEGSLDHRPQFNNGYWPPVPARPYTASYSGYYGPLNGHGTGTNGNAPYRNEAGHGAGGHSASENRPLENSSVIGSFPGVYNNQYQQERPASSENRWDRLLAVSASDNQGNNGSAEQSDSSNSSNAGYPAQAANGVQGGEHGRDANLSGSTHDNYQNGGENDNFSGPTRDNYQNGNENANGHQYAVEGNPPPEQDNKANASHTEDVGRSDQHVNHFADPDADADGEEDLEAEEPQYQPAKNTTQAPPARAYRHIELDKNYDDDVVDGTPF